MKTVIYIVIVGMFLTKEICAGNPAALVTRITQRGLDYASTVGFTELHKQFQSIRSIPNIVNTGDTYYSLTNMYLEKLSKPDGNIAFVPGHGLKWSMTILNAQITGNWRYSKKLWFFRIGDSGSMKVNMPATHVEIIIKLSKTPHGALDVKATHCTCDINFSLETYNWFYNMVIFIFKGTIRNAVRSQVCEKAISVINDNGYEQIVKFPLIFPIGYDFTLDYRLVNDPVITSIYMQLEHKAKISWHNEPDVLPFKPEPLPYISDNGKMLYFVVSNYLLDSWAFQAHKHHVLRHLFTTKHLPEMQKDLLMTSCAETSICIGHLIPELGDAFPNSEVTVEISTLDRPKIRFHFETIEMIINTLLHFIVHLRNSSSVNAFGIRVDLKADLKATVNSSQLFFNVNSMSFQVGDSGGHYLKEYESLLQVETLEPLIELAVQGYLVPIIDENGARGIPLIIPDKVSFNETELTILENAAVIATDLTIHAF